MSGGGKTRYWRAAMWFAVVAAAIALALGMAVAQPAPAWAQTLEGCDAATPPTNTTSPSTTRPGNEVAGEGACSTLMEKIVPGSDPGPYPTSHYDVGYDQGAVNHVGRKILGFLTDLAFSISRWLVRVGLWVVSWALGFGFADRLAAPAQSVADSYQTKVVQPLGLEHFFLVLAAAYGGWQALRGRLSRGSGEFMVSVVIAALAATVLAYPGSALLGALKHTSELSMEVAAITTSADPANTPADPDDVAGSVQADIHRAFVETPHELINWGRTIPVGDPCRAVYEQIVASGPWGSKDEPRDAMKAAGCDAESKFNHDPSADRLGAAVLVAIAAFFVMLMLVLIAVTLVAAQLGVVVAVALSPLALVAGVLPGNGRQLFWRWVAGIGRALAAVVMTAVFLSLFLVGVSALLEATKTEALMVQMGVIDLVVLVAIFKRGKLLKAGRRAVTNFTQRLEQSRVGGATSGGWLAPAAAGAAVGFGTDELMDQARSRGRHYMAAHRQAGIRRAVKSSARSRHVPSPAMAGVAGGVATGTAAGGGAAPPGPGPGGSPGATGGGPTPGPGGGPSGATGAAPAGPGPTGSGGRSGASPGPGAASRAQRRVHARMRQTRSGQVALGAAKVTVAGAKLALGGTVGLPVYGPRAARAATAKAAELKGRLDEVTQRKTQQARAFGREYAQGVAAVPQAARRSWQATQMAADDVRRGVRLGADDAAARRRGGPPPAPAPRPHPGAAAAAAAGALTRTPTGRSSRPRSPS